MGDLLLEIVIWIIRGIVKGREPATRVRQMNRRTVNSPPNTGRSPSSARPAANADSTRRPAVGARTRPQEATVNQPTASSSEQQTAEVWEAYLKKQEALEAEFQAKAPK
jgi:hypothetical protein